MIFIDSRKQKPNFVSHVIKLSLFLFRNGPPCFALIFPLPSQHKMLVRGGENILTHNTAAVPARCPTSVYLYLAGRNRRGYTIRSKWHRENANVHVIAPNAHEEFLVAR